MARRAFEFAFLLLIIATPLALSLAAEKKWDDAPAAVEARLAEAAKYLSSPELEGRGVGTAGLDRAAQYVAEQFKQAGLKTDLYDELPFQKFKVNVTSELGPAKNNFLEFIGPAAKNEKLPLPTLKLGVDFTPLAVGGSGKIDAPLVFVGYGITAKKEEYDDYAGVDVKGKAVVILRHEPQQQNPHSVFNGNQDSQYAAINRKVSNAYEHGAAVVILVTDELENRKLREAAEKRWRVAVDDFMKAQEEFRKNEKPSAEEIEKHRVKTDELADAIKTHSKSVTATADPIFNFLRGGDGVEGRSFPVLHVRRGVLSPILKESLGMDLAELERKIDAGPAPQSGELKGWRVNGQVELKRTQAEIKNVVGVLEGEGPHAEETIVLGAHYDHLGKGGPGSLAGGDKSIHPGADDNASGTAALLELARQLASRQKRLARRVVFIAFTGEERGLWGSAQYVRQPLIPIEKTVAMLNMDMVGRLTDDKLVIFGTDTAKEFDPLIEKLNEKYAFKIKKELGGFGPSDHASFYAKQIPVLHFFTGSHKEYHRPSDTFEKLNVSGMRRTGEMFAEIAITLADAKARPEYQESKRPTAPLGGGGDRPYFGSIPDFAQDQPGYALTGVTKGSPAEKGGLKAGDIIIQLGDSKIGNLEDFDSALRKFKAGDKAPVVVKRGGAEVKLEVTLAPPR